MSFKVPPQSIAKPGAQCSLVRSHAYLVRDYYSSPEVWEEEIPQRSILWGLKEHLWVPQGQIVSVQQEHLHNTHVS